MYESIIEWGRSDEEKRAEQQYKDNFPLTEHFLQLSMKSQSTRKEDLDGSSSLRLYSFSQNEFALNELTSVDEKWILWLQRSCNRGRHL